MQSELTIDALAREIRRVDGNHSLGAGALAEALMPFLTAALSAEQTQPVAVKALEWQHYGNVALAVTRIGSYEVREGVDRYDLQFLDNTFHPEPFASEEDAQAFAQADYETRIRSALVDVPVEPVASAWLIEDGTDHVWFTVIPSKAQEAKQKGCVVTPLYTSPHLSREGEDTAEVERVCTEAAMQQWENSTKRPDLAEKDRVRGAIEAYKRQAFAFALAATRSGSAIAANGGGDGR